MNKKITYFPDFTDRLRGTVTLAELMSFTDGIVADNPGAKPEDVILRFSDHLTAELVRPL